MTENTTDAELRIAILDDYQGVARSYADWDRLGPAATIRSYRDHVADPRLLIERLRDVDVLVVMRERTPLPRAVLEALPRLRLVTTMGMVNASIDLAAANEFGIVVAGYNAGSPATAELAWALIMAVARDVTLNDAEARAGHWQRRIGVDLAGSTLGIVGLGRLGQAMARYAQVFGMNVLAWSENLTAERAGEHGAEFVGTLGELMERSDIATVHLRLSDRSRDLIRMPELELLGPEGRIVNTSRGPIVNEADLAEALHAGVIAAAALDVFDVEPLPPGHPLLRAPNLLLSPHIGYVSRQGLRAGYAGMLGLIEDWRAGRAIPTLSA